MLNKHKKKLVMTLGQSTAGAKKRKVNNKLKKKKLPSPNYDLVGHERVNNIITG